MHRICKLTKNQLIYRNIRCSSYLLSLNSPVYLFKQTLSISSTVSKSARITQSVRKTKKIQQSDQFFHNVFLT